MREKIALILSLYEEGIPLSEIQEKLKLSCQEFSELLKIIRDAGYNTTKSYTSDGTIVNKLNKTLNFKTGNSIRINVKDRILRAIFYSDLHLGSIYERPEYLNIVNEYALAHNIHVFFNGGDMVENVYRDSPIPLKYSTIEEQVNHVIDVHPHHKNQIYFNLYGNHDYKSIIDSGLDIARIIEDKRYDMISLGYGCCIIHLKDDSIAIVHDLKKKSKLNIPSNINLIFRGHSHKFKNRENKIIYIPSLSDNNNAAYEFKPLVGFLDTEFIFYNKKIAKVNIKQLAIVNDEIRLANEETIPLIPDYVDRRSKGRSLTKDKNSSN